MAVWLSGYVAMWLCEANLGDTSGRVLLWHHDPPLQGGPHVHLQFPMIFCISLVCLQLVSFWPSDTCAWGLVDAGIEESQQV